MCTDALGPINRVPHDLPLHAFEHDGAAYASGSHCPQAGTRCLTSEVDPATGSRRGINVNIEKQGQ